MKNNGLRWDSYRNCFFTMFSTVNIGFNSIFLYSKNSECDIVDIKAQLIFTVMIYDRKSSLLFDRFCWVYKILLVDIHVVLCWEIKDFLLEKNNRQSIYLLWLSSHFVDILDSVARNKYSGDRGSSGGGDRSAKRQGNLEFNPSLHNEKPDKHYLIQKFQDSQRQAQIESRAATAGGKSKDRYFKESGTVIDHSGSNNTNRIRRDSDHRTPHRRHGECYLSTEIHYICRPVCMGCYILVGVSILSSLFFPMMMQKNYWMLAESEELRNIF